MAVQTVKYLKEDRGRFFYRRRVPKRYQQTLGVKMWTQPCSDVSYAKAVGLVSEWSEKRDKLLAALEDPQSANGARRATEANTLAPMVARMVSTVETLKTTTTISEIGSNGKDVVYDLSRFDPLEAAKAGIKAADSNPAFDTKYRLVRYRAIFEALFGRHVDRLVGPDSDRLLTGGIVPR